MLEKYTLVYGGDQDPQNGWYSVAYNGGDDFIPDEDISVVR